MPKFGEWDVSDPASAEGFTVIFNKARTVEKTGGRPESPAEDDCTYKHGPVLGKPTTVNNAGVVGCILNPEAFRAVLKIQYILCIFYTGTQKKSIDWAEVSPPNYLLSEECLKANYGTEGVTGPLFLVLELSDY